MSCSFTSLMMLRDTLAALAAESASASAKTASSLGVSASDQLPDQLSGSRRGAPAIVHKAAACIDEELLACALSPRPNAC